jgi:hypothetical protein
MLLSHTYRKCWIKEYEHRVLVEKEQELTCCLSEIQED